MKGADVRLTKVALLQQLATWDHFLKRKVRLIACGGTAMTLLGVKASTKDVDFMIPDEKEYAYLIAILRSVGYEEKSGYGFSRQDEPYVFDLFPGKRIHTTELLQSPLDDGRHGVVQQFRWLYVGVLNPYDLIVSKLFRGSAVDFEDCAMLVRAHRDTIDISKLEKHFYEMAAYDIAEERVIGHWRSWKSQLAKEGII